MTHGPHAVSPDGEAQRPSPRRGGRVIRAMRRLLLGLKPNQRLRATREGKVYVLVWLALLAIGLYQQSNLVLLTTGLAAGPMAASIFISAAMLRRLEINRRAPRYVFADEPLAIDYVLENHRHRTAALAMIVEDELNPSDRSVPEAVRMLPRLVFPRVPAGGRDRYRWQADSPARGRYHYTNLELVTRAPFGLWERSLTVPAPDELIVYPRVGTLSRRWNPFHRESTETKRGRRHDRSANQLDYHGLRDYRPGDSPRWIHWRTTARLGQPMVKEFEQQNDQEIAVLLDPWLPRGRASADQRENLEAAISFAATVCLDLCRRPGRRLLLGWAGMTPMVLQGTASIRLLHELLGQLAVLHGSASGGLATLFDALPPQAVREAMFLIISTRPVNLNEEAERSHRLHGAAGRNLVSRVLLLDASRGELDPLIQFGGPTSRATEHDARNRPRATPDRDRAGSSVRRGRNPAEGPSSTVDAREGA